MPEFMSFAEAALTEQQRRLLDEIRAEGPRTYRGHAEHTVRALEAAALIDAEWKDGQSPPLQPDPGVGTA
jgi:hypothetical protein